MCGALCTPALTRRVEVMLVVDSARGMCDELRFIMDELGTAGLKGRLVLNKVCLRLLLVCAL